MAEKLFYFLSFLTILSALLVVFSKNPVHSVIYLILCFFTLSGHYILLNAQFLAAVNIIVYAGAIMVLFLFTIMFLNLRTDSALQQSIVLRLGGTLLGGFLFLIMVAALKDVSVEQADALDFNSQIGIVENLGKVLFDKYLIPFELVSVLFLSAMVGAVMLGKREAGERII
jgi:NADH-quinone oxidoreductase subunit J